MPAIVGMVARETPPAICLASPPPVMANTLNTSIIPVTVPSRPSSGHRLTNVTIMSILVSTLSCTREIRAWRTWRAFQDFRSGRVSQISKDLCTSPFRPPLKYQTRSKIRVHITKARAAINNNTEPPWSRKALMAADASINANMLYLLLALSVFSNNAGRLLFNDMDDTLGATIHDGMQQHHGNSNNQTQYCCNQSCGDTTCHVFRITGTKDSDGLEGHNHPRYRTQ